MVSTLISSCRAIMPQPLVNGDLNISISFNGDGWVALAVVVVVVFAFVALSNLVNHPCLKAEACESKP